MRQTINTNNADGDVMMLFGNALTMLQQQGEAGIYNLALLPEYMLLHVSAGIMLLSHSALLPLLLDLLCMSPTMLLAGMNSYEDKYGPFQEKSGGSCA